MANIDFSKLPPALQAALFSASRQSGQQPVSTMNETDAPTAQDPQAQAGINPGLAQFLQGTGHLPQDEPQPVDVGQQGPSAPSGIGLATGPKLQPSTSGVLQANVPANNPLLRLFGVTQKMSVGGPNYYDAAHQSGLDKYLPQGLAQTPDGTPYVGPETFKNALDAHKVLLGQGNQVYTSLDQLTTQGVPEDVARKMLAANPTGVTAKEINNQMGRERLGIQSEMADARATMAGVAKMGQVLKVGGFDAAQEAAKKAVANLGFAQRAQAAIDQITANGGIADQRQRAELATSIAGLVGNGASVVTDEKMNQFLPTSAKGKFANVVEYWTNERQPVNFTGYLPQMQDLLTREIQANKGISNGAQQLGIDILGQSQPKTAAMLNTVRAQNPLVGNSTPAQAPQTGQAAPTAPQSVQPHFSSLDDVKSAYKAGKLTLDQAKALAKAMHKAGN